MPLQLSPLFLTALALAVVPLAASLHIWRTRDTYGSIALLLLMLAAAQWSLCYGLEVASTDLSTNLFWAKAQWIGLALSPVLWLATTAHGTRDWPTLLGGWRWLLWLLVPLLIIGLVVTNDVHGLMWKNPVLLDSALPLGMERGVFFWLNAIFAIGLCLLATMLAAAAVIRLPMFRRRYAAAVLAGTSLPWLGNILYLAGIDLAAPLAYWLGGLVLSWGLYQIRLLNLVPIARSAIVESMPDGVMVLDDKDCIIDCNPAALQLLNAQLNVVLGQPVATVLKTRQDLLDRHSLLPQAQNEIVLNDRICELRIAPMSDRLGRPTGRLILVRDVTQRRQVETELREQKDLLENLVAVARATSEHPALEATLENVMRVGVNLTAAERGELFMLNSAGEVTQTVSIHDEAPAAERRAVIERLIQEGLAGWVVREHHTAFVTDTQADDRWLSLTNESPAGSALAVPILSEQALLGVLILTHSQPHHFTSDHVRLIEAAADQMALAVRNAQWYEAQRRMAERQTTLYEVLRAVSGQLDAETIAQTAVEAIAHFAGWPHVALLLADNDARQWTVRAVSGSPSLPVGFSLPIAPEVPHNGTLPGAPAPAGLIDLAARAPDMAHLVVPLWYGGNLSGILNIEGGDHIVFDADDLSLAQSLADAVALALDNSRLYTSINDERSRLQASIRFNRDGIALLGMTQRILVINTQALRLLELPGEPEDWLNRSIQAVIRQLRRHSPIVVKTMIGEIRRARHGDEPPAEGEYAVATRMLHWTSLPVLSNAQPIGRLIVLHDVTEEHQLNVFREDLTNTMVHDLRNPASVVMGALDLLEAEGVTEMQREVVEVARQGGQRLLNLINAILDVNRLESGQMPLEREPVRLDIIAAEIVELEQVLARNKRLNLENQVRSDLPLVSVDVELLRRVLQNLLGNAIKFTRADGHITLTAQADPADAQQVIVSVNDDGPGITPELQARLFQKFVSGRTRNRGSGLGLAFCRLVVEAHGGHIWAESPPGSGAAFHFSLPVAED